MRNRRNHLLDCEVSALQRPFQGGTGHATSLLVVMICVTVKQLSGNGEPRIIIWPHKGDCAIVIRQNHKGNLNLRLDHTVTNGEDRSIVIRQ